MTHEVELDFSSDCPLDDFLRFVEKHRATVRRFVVAGPAGGNPCVILGFDHPENAVEAAGAHERGVTAFISRGMND